ncbi:MAG: hypothetical protein AAB019_05600 [Planctomycetota bacterium]
MRSVLSKYLLVIAIAMLIILIGCIIFLPGYLRNLGKNSPAPETTISPVPTVSFSSNDQPPIIEKKVIIQDKSESVPSRQGGSGDEREYQSSRIRAFFREPAEDTKEMKRDDTKQPEEETSSSKPAPEDARY